VIKVTPQDHPDLSQLRHALTKYSYIGRTSNERKLIAESQRELRSIRLITTISEQLTPFALDDILFCRGQFEMREYNRPVGADDRKNLASESATWGLRTLEQKIGAMTVSYFTPFGKSMESFLSKTKIAIFLFRNYILFGVQKTVDKFKLKFSCKSSEVLWDFGKEHGPEQVMLYAPFGSLLLKFAPPKGTAVNFERNRWRSDAEKFGVIEEGDEVSPSGMEICYASWVSQVSGCVHSQLFYVECQTKTQAKEKILSKLNELGMQVMKKSNPLGGQLPLINYDWQTLKLNEGQESDVLSDIPG
jgi:hypothetical protein